VRILLVIGALFFSVPLVGCGDEGQSGMTKEEMNDPDAGKKALEKMGAMPTPKTAMPTDAKK
jgi:hypothetical protein